MIYRRYLFRYFLLYWQCKLEDRIHALVNSLLSCSHRSLEVTDRVGVKLNLDDGMLLLREVVVPGIITSGSMQGLLANLIPSLQK